ncbi:unnamed protein product [Soboliphyme baturini]|uniref:Lzipper-MIP1 domain-containing protein n=1 Tax=Soboliphyme baturini TaxID=241478 RepID=A0A183IXR8_9BILA|nr:unnamed protein product [Soboliphyme baturini]
MKKFFHALTGRSRVDSPLEDGRRCKSPGGGGVVTVKVVNKLHDGGDGVSSSNVGGPHAPQMNGKTDSSDDGSRASISSGKKISSRSMKVEVDGRMLDLAELESIIAKKDLVIAQQQKDICGHLSKIKQLEEQVKSLKVRTARSSSSNTCD